MLTDLRIENVAVIEAAHVTFGPGLNVITGETGAGKSILLASLSLGLGGRATAELVRTGAAQARVEVGFTFGEGAPALAALAAEGFKAPGGRVLIERTVPARGAGRSSLNGQPITLRQLRAVAPWLLDLCVQHAHHVLLDPEQHLHLLDDFAGLGSALATMSAAWTELGGARAELERLRKSADHVRERGDMLRYQLAELEDHAPRAGEHAELLAERKVQRHAVELGEGLAKGHGRLYAEDGAAVELLAEVEATLRRLAPIDPSLEPHLERLSELLCGVEELARALQRAAPVHDPLRLDEIEGRLSKAERLARKHGCSPDELAGRAEALRQELDELENLSEHIERAERAVRRAGASALEQARALRRARMKAAAALEAAVTAELASLSMPGARFCVVLEPLARGEALEDGTVLDAHGMDHVELHLSANPGEEPRNLARVASGGELSRVLLAIRAALRGLGGASTLVFDEVDAGISGVAAQDVGRKLRALSVGGQVICITHLAQVAALADLHLAAVKHVEEGRTRSTAMALDEEGRVGELARLVGGQGADPAARSFARELLLQARAPAREGEQARVA